MQIDPAGTIKILRCRTPSKKFPQLNRTTGINSINEQKDQKNILIFSELQSNLLIKQQAFKASNNQINADTYQYFAKSPTKTPRREAGALRFS